MSSVNDSQLDINTPERIRTTTLSLDLANGSSRVYDLTENKWGGLDFDPDYVKLKYIAFSSQNANPGNFMPVITCDFIDGDILAPYIARTSIQSFNMAHKVSFSVNKQYATITSRVLREEEEDQAYVNGVVLIGLEWIRYARWNDTF